MTTAEEWITSEEVARRRLAREIHDAHCQRLAIMSLHLERLCRQLPDGDPRRAELDDLGHGLAELAEDLRRLGHDLHPMCYVSPAGARPPEAAAAGGERPADAWRPGVALTPREHDVVRLVGRGRCNKEIAKELGVSVTTVRTHLNRIYGKLAPGSRVELALLAAQGGAHRAR